MKFFLLRLLDIFYIFQLFVQLLDTCILNSYLVLKHIQSTSNIIYLSADSVDISLAFRSLRTALYISICLYAFASYFFYFYKLRVGL